MTVCLPPPPNAAPPLPPRPPVLRRALQVWVVDDDPVIAFYLGDLLVEHGHVVTTMIDPRQALSACAADPHGVDVVVTDQRMPALSGEQLARAMLALRPQIRVILYTGDCEAIDGPRALTLGVQHFLRKPFDARALLQAVRGSAEHGQ